MLPLADILIESKHANSTAVYIPQRQLVLEQPQNAAIARRARLLKIKHRLLRLNDLAVPPAKKLGVFLPGHVEIGLADNLFRGIEPGILGEPAIATKVNRIAVLP